MIRISDRSWAALERFIVCYAAWVVLVGGRGEFLLLGVPVCLLAAMMSERIWRAGGKRIRLWLLIAYMPGFLWRSLKGGIDVAQRVLAPTVRISPAFVPYECREDDNETARVLFCDALSLMPGTLASGLEGRRALVHLLADEAPLRRVLAEEEARVRRIFQPVEDSPRRGSA